MNWIKCKNDSDKLQAIKEYCNSLIANNEYNINYYKRDQISKFDYADEIHALELENMKYKKILEIIEADEFMNVAVY